MPKLPGADAVGSPGTFRSGRDYLSRNDVDGGGFGRGLASLGGAVSKISAEIKNEADDLDLIRADAHWKKSSLTSAEAIEADPDHAARGTRWGLESSVILDDSANMIRDPKMREKFKLQKDVDRNTQAERFKGQAVAADKDKKLADLRSYLDEVQGRATHPKRDNSGRFQDFADLDAYIQIAEKKGLLNPEQSRAFRNDYIQGTQLKLAETLDPDEAKDLATRLLARKPQAGLGDVSAKYESGGRGVGFISTGKDDPGGMSYGVHQLSGEYSMGAFLKSPESGPYRDAFKGLKPQSAEFNRVYKEIAAKDPDAFAKAQKDFYTRTHYEPVKAAAEKAGFNTKNRAVQEALFSMGVQHGKAADVVAEAGRRLGKNKGDARKQVEALYEARYDYVKGLSTLPDNTKQSVLDRYGREFKDALKFADIEDKDEPGQPTRVADAGAKLPGGTATDATPGSMPAEGGAASEDAEREALAIKLFGALDPVQLTRIARDATRKSSARKESAYHDATKSLEGATKMIEDFGAPPEGFDLEGTFKVVAEAGEPSVVNRMRQGLVKAQRIYDAKFDEDGTPIERMTAERLEAHKQALVPTPDLDPRDYAISTEVYEKTKQKIDRLEKMRKDDPALAVDEYPEVKGIAEAVALNDGSATQADLVEARLAAQERIGIDPDDQRPLTKVEAKALLDLPDDPSRLTEKQYKLRLQSAADRAEQQYGPALARRVFESAIAVHVKDKTGSEASAPIISKMVKGETVKLEDYRRMNTLFEVDRIGSTFDRNIRTGLDDDNRPMISPLFGAEDKAVLGAYIAQSVGLPTPEAEEWIARNPDKAERFDLDWGRGAAARAMAKVLKTQKPAR
jgi:hypothetical protein